MEAQILKNKQTQTSSLAQEQKQKLSPLLKLEVKLLRMSAEEFEQDVKDNLESNPALEEVSDAPQEKEDGGDEFDEQPQFSDQDYVQERILDFSPDDVPSYYDPETTFQPQAVQEASFHESLLMQMASCSLTPKQQKVMYYLIGSLDDDGFLRSSPQKLCDEMEVYQNLQTSKEEVEEMIELLKTFEPTGVGAKDLQECLLLQLKEMEGDSKLRYWAIKIITLHFDLYSKRDYAALCRRFNLDLETLRGVYALTRGLKPQPAQTVDEDFIVSAHTIIADFVVRNTDDGFEISLASSRVPRIKVSQTYLDYASQSGARASLQQKSVLFQLNEGRMYVAALRRRQETMLNIMRAIVRRQHEFFSDGDRTLLHPMTQSEIAQEIGRSISSVSAVVSNKYVDTEFGIIALSSLFSQGLNKEDGKTLSAESIKESLRRLVDSEDKNQPIGDAELAQKLGIARRTVVKYRTQLNIPRAGLRKK